jgi:hypothetical protein
MRGVSVAAAALNAGRAVCRVAAEAARRVAIALLHAERLAKVVWRRGIVPRCKAQPVAVPIPGDAMFDPPAVAFEYGCNRLFA